MLEFPGATRIRHRAKPFNVIQGRSYSPQASLQSATFKLSRACTAKESDSAKRRSVAEAVEVDREELPSMSTPLLHAGLVVGSTFEQTILSSTILRTLSHRHRHYFRFSLNSSLNSSRCLSTLLWRTSSGAVGWGNLSTCWPRKTLA